MIDDNSFESIGSPQLLECRNYLESIATTNGDSNVILIADSLGMFEDMLYGFHQVMRKLPQDKPLMLIIDSHGGSIDVAYSIATICRERFDSFKVVVPFMAKSAATLLVLAANERFLASSALLGPVDPQVMHPERRGVWFPAHAIREALLEAESTTDSMVKMSMADKLDPFLIGAYKTSIAVSVQYITEVVDTWEISNKAEVISAFTDKYKSHGYPMSRKVLDELKISYANLPADQEDLVYDLHQSYTDLLRTEECVIITSKTDYVFYTSHPNEYRNSGSYTDMEAGLKSNEEANLPFA